MEIKKEVRGATNDEKKILYRVVVHGVFIEWVLSVHLHSIPHSIYVYTHCISACTHKQATSCDVCT